MSARGRRARTGLSAAGRARPRPTGRHHRRRGREHRPDHEGSAAHRPVRPGRPAGVARHRRPGHRRPGGGRAARGRRPARCRGLRRPRLPAVHLRLDPASAWRHADARESHPQSGGHPPGLCRVRARRHGELASPVSRHGTHRGHPGAFVRRIPRHSHGASAFPSEALSVAESDLRAPGHDQSVPEFRIRTVSAEDRRRTAGVPRSHLLARGRQRCRTRARGDGRAVHRTVRPGRLRPRHVPSQLRPGGGHPAGDRRPGRRERAPLPGRGGVPDRLRHRPW